MTDLNKNERPVDAEGFAQRVLRILDEITGELALAMLSEMEG